MPWRRLHMYSHDIYEHEKGYFLWMCASIIAMCIIGEAACQKDDKRKATLCIHAKRMIYSMPNL